MAAGEIRYALAEWLSRFGLFDIGGRPRLWRGIPRVADAVHTTRALPRFVGLLEPALHPIVLDLGPAVEANIAFLGGRLSCKLIIEDLFADLDRHARDGRTEDLPAWLGTRFENADASVDGILCWDVCDYLDGAAVDTLVGEMIRVLKPGGLAFTMFATERLESRVYTRYTIMDAEHLLHRWYPAAQPSGDVRLMGHVLRLFGGLEPVASHLLVHQQREVLFRKPL